MGTTIKPIQVTFNKGTQFPPKLGTLILKPTGQGKAAYTQNIDVSNDKYGNSSVVPGPLLTTIDNNSELTGVPFIKQFYGDNIVPYGFLYFGEGILGVKNVIRRIKDIISGSTPVIDTTGSMTATHSSHTNPKLVDMVYRPDSGTTSGQSIYVVGKDDTDTWVQKFAAGSNSPSLSLVATNSNFTSGITDQFLVYSPTDNNIYWIGQNRIDSIDTSDTHSPNALALGLPLGTYANCGTDWQQNLVIAYSSEAFGDFTRRTSAGRSGIVIWDYVSPSISKNIPSPCRYISALVLSPDGNLLVFGGISEGKSAIYTFTGYGFSILTEYIGDMPRSRHAVDFDAQGRIVWQTVDGQTCRYDKISGIFEHLGSIETGSSAGGILTRGIGSPSGNDFFVSSGIGSTYSMKIVQFGSFVGDGDSDTDLVTTPLAVSGIQTLPQGSNIQAITLHLAKSLEQGEKLELRIYANGSTTPTSYMTMDYSEDGAISSKRETLTLDNINSFSLAVAWKQADGLTTAPPVLEAVVEPESQY